MPAGNGVNCKYCPELRRKDVMEMTRMFML